MASSSINLLTLTIFTLLFLLPCTFSQKDLQKDLQDIQKDLQDLGKDPRIILRDLVTILDKYSAISGNEVGKTLQLIVGNLSGDELRGFLQAFVKDIPTFLQALDHVRGLLADGALTNLIRGTQVREVLGGRLFSGKFISFASLLNQVTQVVGQLIGSLLSRALQFIETTSINLLTGTLLNGMTVFAPTDIAFQNLSTAGLSMEKKVELLLHHVLPKHYTLDDLANLINPVHTLAGTGTDLFLNFTRVGNQTVVSNGVVKTPVIYVLREEFPLAVYAVDQLLWPSLGV